MAITKTQIKKWNEHFNKLSDSEKRVEIAKDVIKQLKNRTIIANTGVYCNFEYDNISEDLYKSDVRSNFDKLKSLECNVCALGAILVSNTKFNNGFSFKQLNNVRNDNIISLLDYFTDSQLTLIEFAFESWNIEDLINNYEINKGIYCGKDYTKLDLTYEQIEKACDFNSDIHEDEAEERMIRIMKNIIKNEGEFIP